MKKIGNGKNYTILKSLYNNTIPILIFEYQTKLKPNFFENLKIIYELNNRYILKFFGKHKI
jgi:hypothetical protein